MIDFLIAYDIFKQTEHIIRVLQDHAEDASCVDPMTYARRNVHFIREVVVALPEGVRNPDTCLDTAGTLGTLKVTIVSASNLTNTDTLTYSDPYVTVCLGLLRVKTHVVKDDLNPVWNSELTVPVDSSHEKQDITLEVWDEDPMKKVQGSDDLLGRIVLPLRRVIEEGKVEINDRALEGTTRGRLTARLHWIGLSIPEDGPSANGSDTSELSKCLTEEMEEMSAQRDVVQKVRCSPNGGPQASRRAFQI
jgi:hypothetical protein